MEILKTVDVYIEGTGSSWSLPVPYYMRDDEGNKFWVNIPNNPDIIAAFEFMGESNILGDLVSVEPKFEDNQMEIAQIRDHNEQSFEISMAAGKVTQDYVINPKTFAPQTITNWPGKKDIPGPTWRCTWTFWKPESAVLVKLAIPGIKSSVPL